MSARGLSGVAASAVLLMTITAGVLILASSLEVSSSALDKAAKAAEARAIGRIYSSSLEAIDTGSGLLLRGVDPSSVELLVVLRSGEVSRLDASCCVRASDGGALVVGEAYDALKSGAGVSLLLRGGGSFTISGLPLSPSSSRGSLEALLIEIVDAALGPAAAYDALVKRSSGVSSVGVVNASLPVDVAVRVYNVEYLLQTTSSGCPPGYSRVSSWGARASYAIEVYRGGALVGSKSGELRFLKSSPGSGSDYASLYVYLPRQGLTEARELEYELYASLWVKLSASSPDPFYYCTNSWSYISPYAGVGGSLELRLYYVGSLTPLLVVDSRDVRLWEGGTGVSRDELSLLGSSGSADSLYIYYSSSPILRASHYVEGGAYNGAQLWASRPRLLFVLAELAPR
ncbi:MAG: hypothetical protein QXU97_00675 [Fervidicoccaceae archaeon]